MGYANTIQALIKNVDEDDKKKMEELGGGLSDSPLDAMPERPCLLTNQVTIPDPEEREAWSHAFRFGSDDKMKMEELGRVL